MTEPEKQAIRDSLSVIRAMMLQAQLPEHVRSRINKEVENVERLLEEVS